LLERLTGIGKAIDPVPTTVTARARANFRWRRVRMGPPTAESASACMVERGMPPLPRVTPHSLRRTYISIALLANNFDSSG
jgi:integrase